MNNLSHTKPRHPSNRATFVHPELDTCLYIFIRNDTVRAPLQRPYSCPFLVLHRSEKYYVIDIKGGADSVTIDRLKSVCMLRKLNNDFGNNSEFDSEPVNNTDTVSEQSSLTHETEILLDETDELPTTTVYSRTGGQIRLEV